MVAGKLAFAALLLGVPTYLHGVEAALIGAVSYFTTTVSQQSQSSVLEVQGSTVHFVSAFPT